MGVFQLMRKLHMRVPALLATFLGILALWVAYSAFAQSQGGGIGIQNNLLLGGSGAFTASFTTPAGTQPGSYRAHALSSGKMQRVDTVLSFQAPLLPTPTPTKVPPTATPMPTATPSPTATPMPTATSVPTATTAPATATPVPIFQDTPLPTATIASTATTVPTTEPTTTPAVASASTDGNTTNGGGSSDNSVLIAVIVALIAMLALGGALLYFFLSRHGSTPPSPDDSGQSPFGGYSPSPDWGMTTQPNFDQAVTSKRPAPWRQQTPLPPDENTQQGPPVIWG
ncbi:MAG TPA: hypothetical protein VKB76_09125 [Ktedonobacterales bacterium]|nr:hypothetical protein [Ktedonobacterales bacterium]